MDSRSHPLTKQECIQALVRAMSRLDNISDVEVLPLPTVMMDSGRVSKGNPAWIKAAVPGEWITNLRGNEKLVDKYFFIRVR